MSENIMNLIRRVKYEYWEYGRVEKEPRYTYRPDEDQRVYLENMKDDPQGGYGEIRLCTWGDYCGEVVTRANYDEFLRLYKDVRGVWEWYGGYGSHGVLIDLELLTRPLDEEDYKDSQIADLRETLQHLLNYPAIEDEAVSNVEMTILDEWIAEGVKDDIKDRLLEDGIYTDETLPDEEALKQLAYDCERRMEDEGNEYPKYEDAVNCYIPMDEFIKYWKK